MPDSTPAYVGTAQQGLVINPKNLSVALSAGNAAKDARNKGDKDGKDKNIGSTMLSALIHLILTPWTLASFYLPRLWGYLFRFTDVPRVNTCETNTSNINEARVEALGSNAQEFPTTEEQDAQVKNTFIESLDLDAICALASRYNDDKPCQVVDRKNGSFNACFFVKFEQDGPERVVRVPIEPILENPWDKVLSEVATIEFLERDTKIPVPHVHGYGRDAELTKASTRTQAFLIVDVIRGEPLDKKLLIEAEEEHRRSFFSQLIDILAELRQLEFPLIGSLMPNPDGSTQPVLGPVISMSAATLRLPPQSRFASARKYMAYQFSLMSGFFSPPVSNHTVDDIKQEIFALHCMERIFDQAIDPQLDKGPFVLNHLDLRGANIIVDKKLRIQGIVDWEFAHTVPRQVFTPPSWITGHDSIEMNKQMHAEFRRVLDENSKENGLWKQLSNEWYGQSVASKSEDQTDMAFCVAHVLRRPADATEIFEDFLAPKFLDKGLDDSVSEFFRENQAAALEAQRRVEQCERYTEYLRENGLYETETDRLLAESKAFKAKWGWEDNASSN
ncbi:APH domain-containing protein [Fusarium sp. LHS14.1]|nr:APH domain-containing protein [Fusarium sp. LHS14.1]